MGTTKHKATRRADTGAGARLDGEAVLQDGRAFRVVRPDSEKWTGRTPPEEIEDPTEAARTPGSAEGERKKDEQSE